MFNIIGTMDLLNAFYQADRLGVGMTPGLQGAAYQALARRAKTAFSSRQLWQIL
jgi:hypothetical protein